MYQHMIASCLCEKYNTKRHKSINYSSIYIYNLRLTAQHILPFPLISSPSSFDLKLRSHLLQILNIFLSSQRFSLVPSIQMLELNLQFIDLLIIVTILLTTAVFLIINFSDKFAQFVDNLLLDAAAFEGKVSLYLVHAFLLGGWGFGGAEGGGVFVWVALEDGLGVEARGGKQVFWLGFHNGKGVFALLLALAEFAGLLAKDLDATCVRQLWPHGWLFRGFRFRINLLFIYAGKGMDVFMHKRRPVLSLSVPLAPMLRLQYDLQVRGHLMQKISVLFLLLRVQLSLLDILLFLLIHELPLVVLVLPQQIEYLEILLFQHLIFLLVLHPLKKRVQVVMAIILQIFALPFILDLQVTQYALDLLALEHESQVFVIREVSVQLELARGSWSFLFWFDGGGYFIVLIPDLELMDGVEQLRQVEVGLQLREVLHNEVHFLMIVMRCQFFLGELLVAVALCEVLGLMVGDGPPLMYCFFDELEELLICHHIEFILFGRISRNGSRCIAKSKVMKF